MMFGKISHLKMSKVTKNPKFRAAQIGQNGSFRGFKMTKIDFT